MMSTVLMLALGLALAMTAITETRIASAYRDGVAAFYAAEAGLARAVADLATTADWNSVLAGLTTSAFVDGPPSGARAGPGVQIDLTGATNVVRCGKRAGCTEQDMLASTDERPWGIHNPRWQLYAYGALSELLGGAGPRPAPYVVVWVADDPIDNDGNAAVDGGPPLADAGAANPGRDIVMLRAHAYGPGGVRRVIEATVARRGEDRGGGVEVLTWYERR